MPTPNTITIGCGVASRHVTHYARLGSSEGAGVSHDSQANVVDEASDKLCCVVEMHAKMALLLVGIASWPLQDS